MTQPSCVMTYRHSSFDAGSGEHGDGDGDTEGMSEWEEDNGEDDDQPGDESMSDGDSSSVSAVSTDEVSMSICTPCLRPHASSPGLRAGLSNAAQCVHRCNCVSHTITPNERQLAS